MKEFFVTETTIESKFFRGLKRSSSYVSLITFALSLFLYTSHLISISVPFALFPGASFFPVNHWILFIPPQFSFLCILPLLCLPLFHASHSPLCVHRLCDMEMLRQLLSFSAFWFGRDAINYVHYHPQSTLFLVSPYGFHTVAQTYSQSQNHKSPKTIPRNTWGHLSHLLKADINGYGNLDRQYPWRIKNITPVWFSSTCRPSSLYFVWMYQDYFFISVSVQVVQVDQQGWPFSRWRRVSGSKFQ